MLAMDLWQRGIYKHYIVALMCRLCRLPERPRLGRLPRSTSWPGDLQRFFFLTNRACSKQILDDAIHTILVDWLVVWKMNFTWILFSPAGMMIQSDLNHIFQRDRYTVYHQLEFRWLVGVFFSHGFYDFPFHMGCHPSHWRTHFMIFQRGTLWSTNIAIDNYHL